MPIIRIKDKLVYFAHVPKCAGTAIERYLGDRFGALGFLDRGFHNAPEHGRWNNTSPQHIPSDALDRLFPPSFFAASFAVVRHPADRMVSVFRYQRDVLGALDDAPFSEWLARLSALQKKDPFYLDNHTRPMSDFVPKGATVFKLEKGTEAVLTWLDELVGQSDDQFALRHRNTYAQRLKAKKLTRGPETMITNADRELLADIYRVDFERFEYAKDP